MKISDPKILLECLEEKYTQWNVTRDKKKRAVIEDFILYYINHNMDDEIYLEANDGRASGLCSFPYFSSDMKRLIILLKSKVNQPIQ